MPRRNFFQLTSCLLDVKKKWKPINRTQIFNSGRKRPERPEKKRVAIENSLRLHTRLSPLRLRKRFNSYFDDKNYFFQNSGSCPWAYPGAGCSRKSSLDGATVFLWKIWQHITTVSFVSAFILFISNMHDGFFLYRAGIVITRWMLEKDIIVTPTLQRGKN